MTVRTKHGGRVKGTPNKATVARLAAGPAAPAPNTFPLAPAREATIDPAVAAQFPAYRLARVDSLIAYDKNPRVHSDAQIALLAKLITEFGWTNPVLVDGKHGVVAGHGRVLAAKKLGMDVVPTIELSHLSAAQRRAYILADNASALQAAWDDDLLRIELSELKDAGFDLSLTGFDGLALDVLFGEGPTGQEDLTDDAGLDGKVCCPSCGHEFATVDKAFRLITKRKPKAPVTAERVDLQVNAPVSAKVSAMSAKLSAA